MRESPSSLILSLISKEKGGKREKHEPAKKRHPHPENPTGSPPLSPPTNNNQEDEIHTHKKKGKKTRNTQNTSHQKPTKTCAKETIQLSPKKTGMEKKVLNLARDITQTCIIPGNIRRPEKCHSTTQNTNHPKHPTPGKKKEGGGEEPIVNILFC